MPVQRSPFDLVIFDCDGVLVDSEVISCRTLVDILSPLDPSYDLQTVMRRYLGRPSSAVVKDYERMTGRPASTGFTEDWRARLFAAFARELQRVEGVRSVLEPSQATTAWDPVAWIAWRTDAAHPIPLV